VVGGKKIQYNTIDSYILPIPHFKNGKFKSEDIILN